MSDNELILACQELIAACEQYKESTGSDFIYLPPREARSMDFLAEICGLMEMDSAIGTNPNKGGIDVANVQSKVSDVHLSTDINKDLIMAASFAVERAKSKRSKCKNKSCKGTIAKGDLRYVRCTFDDNAQNQHSIKKQRMKRWYPEESNSWTSYFHLKCFMAAVKKGPKSKDEIEGFDDLSAKEQNKVSTVLFNDGDYESSDDETSTSSESDKEPIRKKTIGKKRKLSNATDGSPPKKKLKLSMSAIGGMKVKELKEQCKVIGMKQSGKKADIQQRLKEYVAMVDKVKKNKKNGKYEKEKKKYEKIKEKVQELRVSDLKAMLAQNRMTKTGNKPELVERVTDFKMYGTLPDCPKCDGGTLKVRYVDEAKYGHGGQGTWWCKGYFEDDEWIRCSFESCKEQKRPKWIEL